MTSHRQTRKGFVIPIIIGVMVLAIIVIGGFCVSFVGGRQGTNHTGEILTEDSRGVDTSGIADEINSKAGGSGPCTVAAIRKAPGPTNMTGVKVPIWKYNSSTRSVASSQMTLTIHKNCAGILKKIFTDAYNDPARPPIDTSYTGCYAGRSNSNSRHPLGGACDVNWLENWCAQNCYNVAGQRIPPNGWWGPVNPTAQDKALSAYTSSHADPRSIGLNDPIAKAFRNNGWGRGLYRSNFDDMMHFSIDGH